MENPINITEQNLQQVGQTPTIQPVETPKANYLMIGGVALVCSLIFGVGGYYLGKQSSNPQYVNNEVQTNPTDTSYLNNPTNTPTTQTITLPTGWSYKDNKECGVKFAIPPKEAPYYYPMDTNHQPSVTSEQGSGRFWDFPRGGTYPNLLSKLYTTKVNLESKQAMAMYASTDEASGYVSQAVSVSCIKNDQLKLTDNEDMLSLLNGQIETYNNSTEEKGMQASTYKINSNTSATKWGKNVMNLVVSEGTTNVAYTMFVTPQYVYEVKVFGATSDTSVKDTAKKIFDNLSFQ